MFVESKTSGRGMNVCKRSFYLAGVLVISLAILNFSGNSQALAQEGKTFVPSGHIYTKKSSRLPHTNSFRTRVESQTDIYETEIYREQARKYQRFMRFKNFSQHDRHNAERMYSDR